MATPFPSIPISQSSTRTTENELNTLKFGNGYEQRFQMGLNYRRDKWNIQWNTLTLTQKNTIEVFISAVSNGSLITWTSPFDTVQKKFVIDGPWSISNRGGNVYSIQLNLRQVFDITG